MKKTLIFLMLLNAFIMTCGINVNAKTANFYEGEYIDGIYMNKRTSSDKSTIYYQKARFFRQTGTNDFAYCIEPATFFNENSQYESTISPANLSDSQIDRIKKIAYYGYHYSGHYDVKWYAVAQMMIWQTADPEGDYYFTDRLNGNRINPYDNEINEINRLINKLDVPAIPDITTVVEGTNIVLEDTNNQLNNYIVSMGTKKNNKLEIGVLPVGTYKLQLRRINSYNTPLIFYTSPNSQDLVISGDIESSKLIKEIRVISTKLSLTKVDSETKSSEARGKASIEGTTYKLYDSNNNEIETLIINKDGYAEIKNLQFGTYYLKEEKSGKGYIIDKNIYKVEITDKQSEVNLKLENEIIKKKIIINKQFGQDTSFNPEKDIIFNIYDSNNQLVETLKTDEYGHAETILPYGDYTIKQLNTKEGYDKVDDIKLIIEDTEEIMYNLKDFKIKVPNTSTNFFLELLKKVIKILCIKI